MTRPIPLAAGVLALVALSLTPSTHAIPVAPPASVDIVYASGNPVPNAGVTDSGIPDGAIWTSFGSPGVDDSGNITFVGHWKAGSVRATAIFAGSIDSPAQIVKVGQAGADGTGVEGGDPYKSFYDPFFVGGGKIGFLAKTGVPRQPAITGLYTNAYDGDSKVTSIALVGDTDDFGDTIKTITSVVGLQGEENTVFFATGTVDALENRGTLWRVSNSLSRLRHVLRQGDTITSDALTTPTTLTSFAALKSHSGSPAQGLGAVKASSSLAVAPIEIVTPAGKCVGIVNEIGETYFNLFTKVPDDNGDSFTALGLPTQAPNGDLYFVGTQKGPDYTTSDNTGIYYSSDFEHRTAYRAFGKGDILSDLDGLLTIASLKDPVVSDTAGSAFLCTIADKLLHAGTVNTSNNLCLCALGHVAARKGTQAPDAPEGANFGSITSVIFPPKAYGPVFLAGLVKNVAGITSANATGIWGVDSTGATRCFLRQGDTIGGKTLKSFTALKASALCPSQARVYNSSAEVYFNAVFTDHTTAILRLNVPHVVPAT